MGPYILKLKKMPKSSNKKPFNAQTGATCKLLSLGLDTK